MKTNVGRASGLQADSPVGFSCWSTTEAGTMAGSQAGKPTPRLAFRQVARFWENYAALG